MVLGGRLRVLRRLITALVAVIVPLGALATTASADGSPASQTEMVVVERTEDGGLEVRTYTVNSSGAGSFSASAAADPDVLVVEPNATVQAFVNDPYRSSQWALDRLDFEGAWATTDGAGVIVAVIDTGVRATHEDLAGRVIQGNDFVNPGGDGTLADHYHGSHVAGIIAASANNGLGIAGGAPGVQILPVRVLNSMGTGSTADVAAGIIWAVDNGADIINLSLGSTFDSGSLRAAVDYAESNNVVVIAAAGNSGHLDNPITFPAAIDDVVAVSSTASTDTRSYFSNFGSWVDVAGPGSGIYSLHGGGDQLYANSSGTSMATPYVAAVAALGRAAVPGLTAGQVREVLGATSIDLGAVGRDDEFGEGLVDPTAAVLGAIAGPDSEWGNAPLIAEDYQLLTSFGRVIRPGALNAAKVQPTLNEQVVGGTPTPTGFGHWLVAGDGGIFAYGDAGYYGSAGDIALAQPIVGMAATPTGEGYWMVGQDGGIFSYGDATYHGSTGNIALNQPIVGMASTPTGNGYWLVARDGGIFTFGDATYHGSTGNIALNQPIVGMAASPTGYGYWLAAEDGGIFTFGDATWGGSLAGQLDPGETVVGMIHDELEDAA